jgi:hypothetical protein
MTDIEGWLFRAEEIMINDRHTRHCVCDDNPCTCDEDFDNELLTIILHKIKSMTDNQINDLFSIRTDLQAHPEAMNELLLIRDTISQLPSRHEALREHGMDILDDWIQSTV